MYARHTATDFSQKPAGLVGGYVAAHVGQHAVGYVLQGDVEIFADIIPAGHHVEYIHREIGWVGVMQPYALHAVDVGQAVDELRQAVSAIKVKPIARQVLGYDVEFPDPFLRQACRPPPRFPPSDANGGGR